MRSPRRLLITAVLLGLTIATSSLAQARANPNPGVLPPNATVDERTYTDWGIAWWQWALSMPAAQNPLTDLTGERCGLQQSGSVWFLGGVFALPGVEATGPVTRNCTIPAGKKLFFPVANVIYIAFSWVPTDTPEFTRKAAWEYANMQGGSVSIDGVEVADLARYRLPPGPAATAEQVNNIPIFGITVPQDNLFGDETVLPAGYYPVNAQDGYYLMLAPLSRGKHTIHIVGTTAGEITVDVTYNLTVGR